MQFPASKSLNIGATVTPMLTSSRTNPLAVQSTHGTPKPSSRTAVSHTNVCAIGLAENILKVYHVSLQAIDPL